MTIAREIGTGTKVLTARLLDHRVPFFVQLMPTERCNLRCRYCYVEFGARHRPDFPLPSILKVIDGLARLGTRIIMVAGGEPTLYRDIGKVINAIVDRGIECSVNTNGMLVPSRIEELKRADMLSISIDGPPEIHDWYRGEGTYKKALEAVKVARRHGLRVQIQFTLTRDLTKAFSHVNTLAKKYGCFIGINFLRPQDKTDGTRVKAIEADDLEIELFLHWLLREKPRTLPYPPKLIKYVLRWPYGFGHHIIARKEELQGFKPIPCAAGRFLMAIDNAGDIYPCTKLFYGRPMGNCADGDIERAWRTLDPLECEACLDLGCNLINSLLRFRPSSVMGLLRNWLFSTRG